MPSAPQSSPGSTTIGDPRLIGPSDDERISIYLRLRRGEGHPDGLFRFAIKTLITVAGRWCGGPTGRGSCASALFGWDSDGPRRGSRRRHGRDRRAGLVSLCRVPATALVRRPFAVHPHGWRSRQRSARFSAAHTVFLADLLQAGRPVDQPCIPRISFLTPSRPSRAAPTRPRAGSELVGSSVPRAETMPTWPRRPSGALLATASPERGELDAPMAYRCHLFGRDSLRRMLAIRTPSSL